MLKCDVLMYAQIYRIATSTQVAGVLGKISVEKIFHKRHGVAIKISECKAQTSIQASNIGSSVGGCGRPLGGLKRNPPPAAK